jgi:hypothetical protein
VKLCGELKMNNETQLTQLTGQATTYYAAYAAYTEHSRKAKPVLEVLSSSKKALVTAIGAAWEGGKTLPDRHARVQIILCLLRDLAVGESQRVALAKLSGTIKVAEGSLAWSWPKGPGAKKLPAISITTPSSLEDQMKRLLANADPEEALTALSAVNAFYLERAALEAATREAFAVLTAENAEIVTSRAKAAGTLVTTVTKAA